MSDLTLLPFSAPFNATMAPPGSKSLTNRALVLSALADGTSELSNVLFADDTRIMLECLRQLGFSMTVDEGAAIVRVTGNAGRIPAESADLFCGNSGTTLRFLAALCALGHGRYGLDGVPRMRQRPVGQLVDMLRNLGARISYPLAEGLPPIEVLANGLPGGLLRFSAGQSSQFLSAILQVSPYARHEIRIDLDGQQTSWPYVAMTMRLMDEFGHTAHLIRDPSGEPRQIIVPRGDYRATHYAIEPDASNATYFMAAAAVQPGSTIVINGLGKHSLQGDVGFAALLARMGAEVRIANDSITVTGRQPLKGIDANLLGMPDTAQTLAVVALFAGGDTILRGLHTLRHKETDRLAALATELTRLGAEIAIEGDTLTISPPRHLRSAAIETYDDHRMAMSFAIAGTKAPGVTIKDAECVSKTYPRFFEDLENLRDSAQTTPD